MKAELTGDEINAKWKSLFKSREEAELANITLMDEVWGIENQVIADTKQLQKEADDARIEKELHKYQELRGNIKKK